MNYRPDNPDPIPLFYQSGYLTISGWYEDYAEDMKKGEITSFMNRNRLKALFASIPYTEKKSYESKWRNEDISGSEAAWSVCEIRTAYV